MSNIMKDVLYAVKRVLPAYWPGRAKYRVRFSRPKVVYILAMPRTGSTLAKRYLGDHNALLIAPNQTYRHSWRMAVKSGSECIVIDKRTNNLDREKLKRIYVDYGNQVWFAGVIRDPRDQLVSLMETDRHEKVPRTEEFWSYWLEKCQLLFDFAKECADRGGNISLIRYEDMATNPNGVKYDFLRWLGIEARAGEVSSEYSNIVDEIATCQDNSEDWKTHRNRKVHKNSIGRWRRVRNPVAMRVITHYRKSTRVAALMERLGYEEDVKPVARDFEGMTFLGPYDGDSADS